MTQLSNYLRNRILLEGAQQVLKEISLRIKVERQSPTDVALTLQILSVDDPKVLIEYGPNRVSDNGGTLTLAQLRDAFTINIT